MGKILIGTTFSLNEVYMVLGFLFALFSCVSNDVIQTLGTFLSSNRDKSPLVIWGFASCVLIITLTIGWVINDGDMAFGRLTRIPFPETFYWWQILPPIVLIFLTKWGIPVSTTFLILSVFSSNTLIGLILTKSLIGYVLAFVVSLIIYIIIARPLEKEFLYSRQKPSFAWIVGKWISTAFLWSMWICQDAANLFVFLPRKASFAQFIFVVICFVVFLGYVAYKRGGEIQNIVKFKTNTQDIRSATIIDLIFAFILLYFQMVNNVPMSTTWVFIGLLAGREIALFHKLRFESEKKVFKHVCKDFSKTFFGLVVSIVVVEALMGFQTVKLFLNEYFKG